MSRRFWEGLGRFTLRVGASWGCLLLAYYVVSLCVECSEGQGGGRGDGNAPEWANWVCYDSGWHLLAALVVALCIASVVFAWCGLPNEPQQRRVKVKHRSSPHIVDGVWRDPPTTSPPAPPPPPPPLGRAKP